MSDTDRLAALLSEVIALDCLPFEATHGPNCLLQRIQDALPDAGVTLAPQPDTASRELREAARRLLRYSGNALMTEAEQEDRAALRAALAATEGER